VSPVVGKKRRPGCGHGRYLDFVSCRKFAAVDIAETGSGLPSGVIA
jgi:hypothetical protein